ncbi:hypothetical protein, partial [Staphylococcus aureus]|uniref:hypothetical protein n=1 Tax=Staphylococcus aureus TaxID=1280 RepID=UPI0021B094FE
MKLFRKALLIYLGILVIITYAFAWGDLTGNKQLTGDVFENVLKSFTYYITDVIVYWWMTIIVGALVLTVITVLLNEL